MLIDDLADKLVDRVYDRMLTASQTQDDGLDTTTLGKSTSSRLALPVQQAQLTNLRGLSAWPRAVSMQQTTQPQVIRATPVTSGTPVDASPGTQCFQARVQSVTVRAAASTPTKVVKGKEIPWNVFKKNEPLKAKVIKNVVQKHTITEDTGDANWETVHVTFDTQGKFPYVEGMSLGLIAPGPDKKTGKDPAAGRLYSIASSAVGDDQTSNTVSLCVKRVVELDGKFANREVGEDKPDKAGTHFPKNKVYRGVASNYICDLNEGDEVEITGPVGTEMLLPQDPDSAIIMLATGTGIAPMRSYLRLLFNDKAGEAPDGSRKFKGLAWLFLGVPYAKSLLYDDENQEYAAKYPENFRYDYAVSREQKNAAGQKMYIQTRIAEYAQDIWDLLQNKKSHVYMCGLKGMESGMEEALGPIAEGQGIVWKDFVKSLKKEDRYHVEVY